MRTRSAGLPLSLLPTCFFRAALPRAGALAHRHAGGRARGLLRRKPALQGVVTAAACTPCLCSTGRTPTPGSTGHWPEDAAMGHAHLLACIQKLYTLSQPTLSANVGQCWMKSHPLSHTQGQGRWPQACREASCRLCGHCWLGLGLPMIGNRKCKPLKGRSRTHFDFFS